MTDTVRSGGDESESEAKHLIWHCDRCGWSGPSPICPHCAAILTFNEAGHPEIRVHGASADEVEKVSRALFAKAPETRPKKQFPLVSGIFFLIMFVVIFGAILTAARLLPIYVFPIVLIAGILTFSVVGAFILKQDENLSEKGFLDLMKLSFQYLPLLRKR